MLLNEFDHGNKKKIDKEIAQTKKARKPIYKQFNSFKKEIKKFDYKKKRELKTQLKEVEEALKELFGPFPSEPEPVLLRNQYGQARWKNAEAKLHNVLYSEEWDYSDPTKSGIKISIPRTNYFAGTSFESFFPYLEKNLKQMMMPEFTFYWGFLTDKSKDSHFFGGIMPEILGTVYLALGAMIFAVPLGILAAIYLAEYAKPGKIISFLRICMGSLAGVPSIVFGLFGLAFFINTIHVSNSKSVLAGSLTLAILILPTVIRSAEEAIKAVPNTYREAALGLGAGKWHSVWTVVLPNALPGILTGTIISLGRAAGETAPIIFTAAVSVGLPLKIWQTLSQPTPALSWNIYNLCTEHEAVDEIRHVQYGMVFVLIAIVLLFNLTAIIARARIMKKLRG
jgi:phosphate transport system permease protein